MMRTRGAFLGVALICFVSGSAYAQASTRAYVIQRPPVGVETESPLIPGEHVIMTGSASFVGKQQEVYQCRLEKADVILVKKENDLARVHIMTNNATREYGGCKDDVVVSSYELLDAYKMMLREKAEKEAVRKLLQE